MKVVTYIHKGKVVTLSIDDLRKMKVELSENWESLCLKCGKCCFDKKLSNDVLVIDYDKPCSHLKFIGNKASCDIYLDRFSKCEGKCNTIPEAISKRYLPATCPYVKCLPSYKAPIDNLSMYKIARERVIHKSGEFSGSGEYIQPTGGTRNEAVAINIPVTREDLNRGNREYKRRMKERKQRLNGGKYGAIDPREKTEYNIKPSGHGLGG